MYEQKSCLTPKMFDQKSLIPLQNFQQKSPFAPQTFEQKSSFASMFSLTNFILSAQMFEHKTCFVSLSLNKSLALDPKCWTKVLHCTPKDWTPQSVNKSLSSHITVEQTPGFLHNKILNKSLGLHHKRFEQKKSSFKPIIV